MQLRRAPAGRPASALAVVVVAVGVGPAAALAQDADGEPTTDVSLRVYADDDRVTVWSPSARAATPLAAGWSADVATTIDAITAASIDVVSSASPYAFREQRVEGDLGLGVAVARHQRVSLRGGVSDEHDYTALRLGLGWRGELAARNLTVEVGYTLGRDRVGRAGDPTFARDRHEHRAVASVTQILDRRTYLDIVLEAYQRRGYLANPYRFVPIELAGAPAYVVPERVPDEVAGIAGLARIRRALGEHWFARIAYRATRDTWAIDSHSVDAGLTRSLHDDRVLVGIEARGYRQDAATFVRAHYVDDSGVPAWRTADRTLGRMRSLTAGADLDVALPWRELHLAASAAWLRFRWLDDPRQRERQALIASLALHLPL